MIKKQAAPQHLIADGPEEDIIKISLGNAVHSSKAVATVDALKHLEQLSDEIGKEDFDTIIKDGNFTMDEGFIKSYRGPDHLQLYYYKDGNTVSIYAFGEFQPARYKLYHEGSWEIK